MFIVCSHVTQRLSEAKQTIRRLLARHHRLTLNTGDAVTVGDSFIVNGLKYVTVLTLFLVSCCVTLATGRSCCREDQQQRAHCRATC